MNIPVEDWSAKIKDEVKKSQALIAHYEMLCEQHHVRHFSGSFLIKKENYHVSSSLVQLIQWNLLNACFSKKEFCHDKIRTKA